MEEGGGRVRVRSLFSTQIYDGAQETTVNFSGHQDTQQSEGPLVPNLFLGHPTDHSLPSSATEVWLPSERGKRDGGIGRHLEAIV